MVWNEKLKRKIPEGWNVQKVQEIANTYSGGTPKSTENRFYHNGEIPWINSGELNNPIIVSTTNFITQLGLESSSAKLYPKNTILIALYGATAGKVALLSFEACSNQAICGIITKNSVMLDYIRLYLASLYEHFVIMSTGSARDNISQDTIKNTKIIIPHAKILIAFNERVRKLVYTTENNLNEIAELTKLRDQLLPLLMNGQVSVNYDLTVRAMSPMSPIMSPMSPKTTNLIPLYPFVRINNGQWILIDNEEEESSGCFQNGNNLSVCYNDVRCQYVQNLHILLDGKVQNISK
jgi:type I restriction enzyme S subunit